MSKTSGLDHCLLEVLQASNGGTEQGDEKGILADVATVELSDPCPNCGAKHCGASIHNVPSWLETKVAVVQ